jgi:glutathione S-transferase
VESHLDKQGTPYLTYADLSWIRWNSFLDMIVIPGWKFADDFPLFGAWHQRLIERPAVQKILESKDFNYFVHA